VWLYTSVGLFNVVQSPSDDPEILVVQSRRLDPLTLLHENFLPEMGRIFEIRTSGFPFRATVSKTALAGAMVRIVEAINYRSFREALVDPDYGAEELIANGFWTNTFDERRRDLVPGTLRLVPNPASVTKRLLTRNKKAS
jgi:hypothetical protein